jgi:hypothetical protein
MERISKLLELLGLVWIGTSWDLSVPTFRVFSWVNMYENHANYQFLCSIHVRRTDKVGTEAAFHSLSEYMEHVDTYFKVYEQMHPEAKSKKRNVYLASDDAGVLDEADKK